MFKLAQALITPSQPLKFFFKEEEDKRVVFKITLPTSSLTILRSSEDVVVYEETVNGRKYITHDGVITFLNKLMRIVNSDVLVICVLDLLRLHLSYENFRFELQSALRIANLPDSTIVEI